MPERQDSEERLSRRCILGPCSFFLSRRNRDAGDDCPHAVTSLEATSSCHSFTAAKWQQCSEEVNPAATVKALDKQLCLDEANLCRSPVSTRAPSSPRILSSDSLVSFALDEVDDGPHEQITVALTPGLFFYGSRDSMDGSDEHGPLLKADKVELGPDGELRVRAAMCSEDEDAAEPPSAEVQDLMVDVRVHQDDEPRLQQLIGARVHKGRIDRISLDFACSTICCRVCRPGQGDGEHMALEQAIKEMLEFEQRRQNAELCKYQRQICSSMMQAQRRRFLALSEN